MYSTTLILPEGGNSLYIIDDSLYSVHEHIEVVNTYNQLDLRGSKGECMLINVKDLNG